MLYIAEKPELARAIAEALGGGTGLIIALCAASVVYSSNKRKKRIMAELDIEED